MKKSDLEQVSQEVVKQKQKRTRPDRQPQTDPGDNAKYIRHSLTLAKLPKVDLSDNVAVENRVFEYFTICEDNDMKPSVVGLAVALGCSRDYLWKLRTGAKGKNPDVVDTLKRAVELLDLQMVDYMQNGKINPVSGIFLMKNNFGYADKQEVVVTPNNPLEGEKDVAALEEQYQASVPVEAEGKVIEDGESE